MAVRRVAATLCVVVMCIAFSASITKDGYSSGAGVVLVTALMRALPAFVLCIFVSMPNLRRSVWWSPVLALGYVLGLGGREAHEGGGVMCVSTPLAGRLQRLRRIGVYNVRPLVALWCVRAHPSACASSMPRILIHGLEP